MTGSSATPSRRIGAALVAAACGLVVGAAVAAGMGTVQVLLSPGLEIAPGAAIRGPLMILAEGMFWALLGGAMFVFPPAVVTLALFCPPNTRAAALAVSALLAFPIVVVNFRSRAIGTLLLAFAVWLGARVALRTFARMMRPKLQ